jgi:hypothetical protein
MFPSWVVWKLQVMNNVVKTFFFAVLGLELRAFTLSHSTSPFFVKVFF